MQRRDFIKSLTLAGVAASMEPKHRPPHAQASSVPNPPTCPTANWAVPASGCR